jgi:hypothetical protein
MRLFAILALSCLLSAGATAGPVKLTDAQMDAITAGLAVAVAADAVATGEIAITLTDARTKLRARRNIGVAFGRGLAVALGSESAATDVDVSGDGDIVRAWTRSFTFVAEDGLIVSKTIGFVVAIEFPNDQVRNVGSRWKGLRRAHWWGGKGFRFKGRRASWRS